MKKSVVALILLIILTSAFLIEVMSANANAGIENTWETKASMPQVVGGGEAAVVDGKIYVMGGSSNYEYNPITNNWTARTPMPTPRTAFGMVAYQNKIYTIGGWNFNYSAPNPTYYSVNEVYDPATDTWQTKQPMPAYTVFAQANVVNGIIYMISGSNENSSTVVLNEAYNIANDSWTAKAPIPFPVNGYSSAVSGGKIYILGGQDQYLPNQMNVNFNQIYDPLTDTWSQGAPLPTTVLDACAGATTGVLAPKRIYLFGGVLNGQIGGTSLTQVYDPESNTWVYGAPMPTARGWLVVAAVNDIFYAIGGSPILNTPYLTSNEQYTPFGYGTVLPKISILSPINQTYNESSVPLVFSLDRQVSWVGYSLDGEMNETIVGNVTIANLTSGAHSIVMYANDTFGNVAVSQNVTFMVATTSAKSSAPTAIIALSATVAVVVIAVVLLVYFKKHKH